MSGQGSAAAGKRAGVAARRCPQLDLGATLLSGGGTRFRVWAPGVDELAVRITAGDRSGTVALHKEGDGHFAADVDWAAAGSRYRYLFADGRQRPDPVSRFQPEGVHGPSEVVDPAAFSWSDGDWRGMPLARLLLYELHVGTFTTAGTFAAIIPALDYLADLGVTALELMPVAQFPGERNWGYDGVSPFAPQSSYGGPEGLKQLVDACHRRGLAVILDVVYNHLGPEGNYLHDFAPYFTDRYRTPWGEAVNFDGAHSDGVRRYFIANACYWLEEFHLDGLRLDAVHGIFDCGARHFLAQLAAEVHALAVALKRPLHLIAESDLNDVRLVTAPGRGGYGLDAQWSDDFHHALHCLLTGQRDGYYEDFGDFMQLVTAMAEGFVYRGGYSPYRRRSHGSPAAHLPPRRFVVFSQNHDQVGNRARGDRLTAQLAPAQLRLAAAAVLLSPYIPLLFMGEEYAETAPFPYFTSHGDPELIAAVRRGRQEEFARFAWQGEVPDPQAEATFRSAAIDREKRRSGRHAKHFAFTRQLLRLRKLVAPEAAANRERLRVFGLAAGRLLAVQRSGNPASLAIFNLSGETRRFPLDRPHGRLVLLLDGNDRRWGGTGTPAAPATIEADAAVVLNLPPWGVLLYGEQLHERRGD